MHLLSFIHKGHPYFCKHLRAVLATTNKCHDRLKLLELYFATLSNILPDLSTLVPTICNTRGRGNVFSGKQSLLERSHQANKLEEQQAKKGELLKLLHDPQKPAAPKVFSRLLKRYPHNLGFRLKGPIVIKNSNYELKFPAFNTGDPYKPQVKIPHNARGRWVGRKRCVQKKRGLTVNEVALENSQFLAFKL